MYEAEQRPTGARHPCVGVPGGEERDTTIANRSCKLQTSKADRGRRLAESKGSGVLYEVVLPVCPGVGSRSRTRLDRSGESCGQHWGRGERSDSHRLQEIRSDHSKTSRKANSDLVISGRARKRWRNFAYFRYVFVEANEMNAYC